MRNRLASLALILVIGGSVFAGIPLHSNETGMHYARHGGNGLLQEGSQGREPYARSFSRAFVLCSELFAKWNDRLDRVSASAPSSQPIAIHPSGAQPLFGTTHLSIRSTGQTALLRIPILLTFDTSLF